MRAQELRTRTAAFTFGELTYARFLAGAQMTLQDARECIEFCLAHTGGTRHPTLVDLREIRSQSADARAYLAGPASMLVAPAVALVIGSPVSRVLGNFYISFDQPLIPTRLFTAVDDAERWLREYLEPPPAPGEGALPGERPPARKA